jgi:hypothetical protein
MHTKTKKNIKEMQMKNQEGKDDEGLDPIEDYGHSALYIRKLSVTLGNVLFSLSSGRLS